MKIHESFSHSQSFGFLDYEKFKQRVIESIDNDERVVVDSNHLKALCLLSNKEMELIEAIEYLRSLEFRERLIVDYLNVLGDQRELLENRKIKLNDVILPESTEPLKHKKKKIKKETVHLELNELISEESFERLVDLVKLQSDSDQQIHEFTSLIENINNYLELITEKIIIGNQLLELVEKL
jgi:hypothetical protein